MGKEKEKKKWDNVAEYAAFLWQMKEGLENYAKEESIDAVKFIEAHTLNGAQASSLYYAARAERDRVAELHDAKKLVDRRSVIRQEISDFNSLQTAVKREGQQFASLNKHIHQQPKKVQDKLNKFVDENKNYLDLELVELKMRSKNFDFIETPLDVLNVEKMLTNTKSDLLKLNSAVDVLSLH